jgi:hypothetical protein
MINKRVIPFLLLPFFSISNAQAQIDLIAIGQVSGEYQDMAIKQLHHLKAEWLETFWGVWVLV